MSNYQLVIDSPVGPLRLRADETSITELYFADGPQGQTSALLRTAEAQLGEYFAGQRQDFELPLAPSGTDFQLGVWAQLERIPYGETVSYGEVATRLGMPLTASRAVGLANGSNPISIIVPCHRVIGADGSLTGYGGGLDRKRTLLQLEARDREDTLF